MTVSKPVDGDDPVTIINKKHLAAEATG